MNNKFLVIGSNSFSGAQFIDYLLEKNQKVMGVSRSEELNPVFLPYTNSKNLSNYQFHQIDINSSNWSNGIYLLKLECNKGSIVKKLVKE